MTLRQTEYLRIIQKFFAENHQLPPVNHLAELAGTSNNAAHEMLVKFLNLGILKKNTVGKYMFTKKYDLINDFFREEA